MHACMQGTLLPLRACGESPGPSGEVLTLHQLQPNMSRSEVAGLAGTHSCTHGGQANWYSCLLASQHYACIAQPYMGLCVGEGQPCQCLFYALSISFPFLSKLLPPCCLPPRTPLWYASSDVTFRAGLHEIAAYQAVMTGPQPVRRAGVAAARVGLVVLSLYACCMTDQQCLQWATTKQGVFQRPQPICARVCWPVVLQLCRLGCRCFCCWQMSA